MISALVKNGISKQSSNLLHRFSPSKRYMSSESSSMTQPHIELSNGLFIPQLGFGTWQNVKQAVKTAIKVGYRHIDCAAIYGNEREVGEAIKESMNELGLKRSDFWITSKLWNDKHRPDLVPEACQQTIHDLGIDYLDLYLMHWPVDQIPQEGPRVGGDPSADETPLWETYDAMADLLKDGLVKTIGVSNFSIRELESLIHDTDLIPTVNQIEMHPYLTQPELHKYCASKGIHITAYSPLGRSSVPKGSVTPKLIEHPIVVDLATRLGKTPSQILLRWAIQHNVSVIPKSSNDERIKENFDVFDFIIDDTDMEKLNSLNCRHRFVRPSFHLFPDDPPVEGDGRI